MLASYKHAVQTAMACEVNLFTASADEVLGRFSSELMLSRMLRYPLSIHRISVQRVDRVGTDSALTSRNRQLGEDFQERNKGKASNAFFIWVVETRLSNLSGAG